MKNRRLIVILCVLAFITVLVVINSTLFTLQKVNVNWLTTKHELLSTKDYQITDNVNMGQSIFLVNKDKLTSTLEKKYPFLRVVSIETKFPNKIVLHAAERVSMYAIKLSDSEYAIIDEKGKVLKLSNGSIFEGVEGSLGSKPIQLFFKYKDNDGNAIDMPLNPADFVVGEMIGVPYIRTLVDKFSFSLREARYTPTTSKGVIKHIDIFRIGEIYDIDIQTRNGMVLNISDIEKFSTEKLLLAFDRYNALHNEGVVDCTILVWYAQEKGKLFSDICWER